MEEPPVGQEGTVPQGQNHEAVSREMPPSLVPNRWYVVLFGAVLLVGVLLVGLNLGGVRDRLWRQNSSGRAIAIPIQSLAVLPLENLSHDPDQEYFADGLTDALITDLGKVTGLRVISRTSVASYKKTKKPLSQVAHELNVDAIVEGTVLRSGDRVRITAQLVRAAPEEHLWAERYSRGSREVHWTITRAMAARAGYVEEYLAFWSAQAEVVRIWARLYTPQKGEVSDEAICHFINFLEQLNRHCEEAGFLSFL